MGELNVYGVYVPIFFGSSDFGLSYFRFVVMGINRLVEKDWILFPAIFNLCVYLIFTLFDASLVYLDGFLNCI